MFIALKSAVGYTHIDMQSMHGRGYHHHIIETGLGNESIQFAIDKELDEIFWLDQAENKLSFTDFEGKQNGIQVCPIMVKSVKFKNKAKVWDHITFKDFSVILEEHISVRVTYSFPLI